MKIAKIDVEETVTVPVISIEIPLDDAVALLQELVRVKKGHYSEEVAHFIDGLTRAVND